MIILKIYVLTALLYFSNSKLVYNTCYFVDLSHLLQKIVKMLFFIMMHIIKVWI